MPRKTVQRLVVRHFTVQKIGWGRTSFQRWHFVVAMQMVDAKIDGSEILHQLGCIKIPVNSRIKQTTNLVTGGRIFWTINIMIHFAYPAGQLERNPSIWLALDEWNMMKFIHIQGENVGLRDTLSRKVPFCWATFIKDPESWNVFLFLIFDVSEDENLLFANCCCFFFSRYVYRFNHMIPNVYRSIVCMVCKGILG